MTEDMIKVSNLVKKFGDLVAVNDISFNVKKGEIFAFLGPNGAGKTTTIHMLVTLLKQNSGEVFIAGDSTLTSPKEVRKKIGIVFQDPSLDTYLTAYENLYIHGGIYGYEKSKINEKIDEILDFVELKEFKDKVVKTFSGGMERRMEIAKALMHEPDILFLDEPTIGLDPNTRDHVWKYIMRMKEEKNMTIFLTTHYMDEAELLADRIAIIDHGKIIALDTPEKLKKIVGKDIIYLKFLEKRECPKEDFIDYCKELPDGRIEIGVENAGEALPKIFEMASRINASIVEVTYKKPTLSDVFIHLTGREIRDTADKSNTAFASRRRRRHR